VAALRLECGEARFTLGGGQRRQAMDAHEQRVVEQARGREEGGVGRDGLGERHLGSFAGVDHHGNVEPFPVTQRTVGHTAHRRVGRRVHAVQEARGERAAVGGGSLEVKGEPRSHG
jgi:hypothetical protein